MKELAVFEPVENEGKRSHPLAVRLIVQDRDGVNTYVVESRRIETMSLPENLDHILRWWRDGGGDATKKVWSRLGLGLILGSLLTMGLRLLAHDPHIAPLLNQQPSDSSSEAILTALVAYKSELVALCGGVVFIGVPWATLWVIRYARAWRAGIASVAMVAAALTTFWVLNWWSSGSAFVCGAILLGLATIVAADFWRQQLRPSANTSGGLRLRIPLRTANVSAEGQWGLRASDDPIDRWGDDIVGRSAVVEQLAHYALRQRTPVVALLGDLGDGKSSVLNLLKDVVKGQAIVVSFRAWLPGSEATFAAELFRDIVSECRKYVHVPQLRKPALAFARTISGSVTHMGGLKELLPTQSQREEIEELRGALARVPRPILVLLDELDRMQRDELLVLLKILRGASSIPNVTFICAFSEEGVKRELDKAGSLARDYMDKFFPVSIRLSPPDPEMVSRCFQTRIRQSLASQNWFRTSEDENSFATLMDNAWTRTLSHLCTNFRNAGRLLNDVVAAGDPIASEVNPFDLVIIEAIRRFYPSLYQMVRIGGEHLTDAGDHGLFSGSKDAASEFFASVNKEISAGYRPDVARALLSWIFPQYVRASKTPDLSVFRRGESALHDDKRVCEADYFRIYFRAAVPEEMFSNAEFDRLTVNLNGAGTEEETRIVFSKTLGSIPVGNPKRADLLWKLGRGMARLDDLAAQNTAYAAATCALDYQYDVVHVGEGAEAVNIIFAAVQRFAGTKLGETILCEALRRASDDTMAERLLRFSEDPSRNEILRDFSHVDLSLVRQTFMQRMQDRYGDHAAISLEQMDWQALRLWVENSEADRNVEQACLRRFIGGSRKRLAQVINLIYPGGNNVWRENPTDLLDRFFPIEEIKALLKDLPEGELLSEAEVGAITRMQELFEGRYATI